MCVSVGGGSPARYFNDAQSLVLSFAPLLSKDVFLVVGTSAKL